jgi:hypothetical protein
MTQHPSHAERNADALAQLRPGMTVGHANPELAAWKGRVTPNGAGDWTRPGTGDVRVHWHAGTTGAGWISASALTIEGICPDCAEPAHRYLPAAEVDSWTGREGWYHDSKHDELTCWGGKAIVKARLGPHALPEQVGNLIRDIPQWRYRCDEAGGRFGFARLRVWETGDRGHLAVVTEAGSPVSVTNAAGHIWAQLTADYPGRLTVLEHWPEGHSGPEHVDQVTGEGGRFTGWQPLFPPNPANPAYPYLARWLAEHGHLIPVQLAPAAQDES